MWRQFNILKGKWEFWFGSFLFFCHIWKTSYLYKTWGIQTQLLYGIHPYIITSDPFVHMHTLYSGVWDFQPLVQLSWKMIKMSWKVLHCFYLFLKGFCCCLFIFKYILLPALHSYFTCIICENIKQVTWKQIDLMIPKCW